MSVFSAIYLSIISFSWIESSAVGKDTGYKSRETSEADEDKSTPNLNSFSADLSSAKSTASYSGINLFLIYKVVSVNFTKSIVFY